MSFSALRATALLIALYCSGCAYTTTVRVDPSDNNIDGFVYYECKPLVVLTGNAIDIKYVKNPNKAYAVQFGAFLSKNQTKLTFDKDCGITTVDGNLDTTGILTFFSDVLDKVAPDAKLAVAPAVGTGTAVQIYDVIFDDNGGIVELRPLINSRKLLIVPAASQ